MVTIQLTEEDAQMLKGILDNYLGETRSELANTDTPEYRDRLRAEEVALARIIAALQVGAGARPY